jgi:hypothetical protein
LVSTPAARRRAPARTVLAREEAAREAVAGHADVVLPIAPRAAVEVGAVDEVEARLQRS